MSDYLRYRRTAFINRVRAVSFATAMAVVGHASALGGGPIEGYVLDVDTGQPIAGAVVAILWRGNAPLQVTCVHEDGAITDENGRYRTPAWSTLPSVIVLSTYPNFHAHAIGYERARSPLRVTTNGEGKWFTYRGDTREHRVGVYDSEEAARAATNPTNVYLKKTSAPPDARFQYLLKLSGFLYCGEEDGSLRNVYPFFRSLYREAIPLATDERKRKDVIAMRDNAARAWLQTPGASAEILEPMEQLPQNIRKELE